MKTILALLFGFGIGWLHAHYVVASECKRLGKFYVASNVFVCSEVKEEK